MSKKPSTKEQKEWYFLGFFEATAKSLADDLKITLEEAKLRLTLELERKRSKK